MFRLGTALLAVALLHSARADEQLTERPTAPTWLEALFPHVGEPETCANRLRRLEASELPVADGRSIGRVTVEFTYRAWNGDRATGRAMFYIPPELRDEPSSRHPLVDFAGYELDQPNAERWASQGLIVVTPHAEPENPMVRGPNLDIALLHAARALPFVDDSRVFIHGGSAGGYTALMLAAETFPLNGVCPYVPPLNWGYNAAYFFHNRDAARRTTGEGGMPAMPVLAAVLALAEQKTLHYGEDFDGDAWYLSSPVSQLETITCPVLMVYSTADILVPVDQLGAQFVRERDPALFPPGWTSDINTLMARPDRRLTLLALLPEDSVALDLFVVPSNTQRVALPGQVVSGHPISYELPFSRERQWSITVLDEGPIEPTVAHTKYVVDIGHGRFRDWALSRRPALGQLTYAKLRRLMMRYLGQEYMPCELTPPGAAEPVQLSRLDWPEAERADVLRGLLTYAARDSGAVRLAGLYQTLPTELKPFGPTLGSGSARSVRAALEQLAVDRAR